MASVSGIVGSFFKGTRVFLALSVVLLHTFYLNMLQFMVSPILSRISDKYNLLFNMQMERSFASVLNFVVMVFTPHELVITADREMEQSLRRSEKDGMYHIFPENESVVMISNHQLYTDWTYAWLVSKLQGLDGNMKIILKESLRKLPIFGPGMQFLEFVFLKRNWESDKQTLADSMTRIREKMFPTILFLFPEGTTLSKTTREKSKSYSDKNNIQDFKHLLQPRSTGLHYCINELSTSINYVYDLTLGYSGLPKDAQSWPENVYSLKNMFYNGIYPKKVNIHIRRFKVSSIPKTQPEFSNWLVQRYEEKDKLLETYSNYSTFIPNTPASQVDSKQIKNPFPIYQVISEMITIWISAFFVYCSFKAVLFG